MKQAYISVVLLDQSTKPSPDQIEKLDLLLSRETRIHEIILVAKYPIIEKDFHNLELNGPFTILTVQSTANMNDLTIAGLGRSVGDFVLEWTLAPSKIEPETLLDLLAPTDTGFELVEAVPKKVSIGNQVFYKFVNQLRAKNQPVKRTIARLYSRRTLNWILEANRFEPHLMILNAEVPQKKSICALAVKSNEKRSYAERIQEGIILLAKGSRFGTVIPLLLAGISSLFAIGVAFYALTIFLLFGNAAEGWTSIAVVIGSGQAAILALIGLVWSRLDSLAKGLSKKNDVSVDTIVFPANNSQISLSNINKLYMLHLNR